jgi:hypothetical protein
MMARPGTLNARGLLLLLAGFACYLGIIRWQVPYENVWTVVLLGIIPLVLLAEWVFHGRPRLQSPPSRSRLMLNCLAILVAGVVLAGVVAKDDFLIDLPFTPRLFYWLQSPLPLTKVVLLFRYGAPLWVQICVATATFLALNAYLIRVSTPQPIPLRVPFLLAALTVGSIVWFTTLYFLFWSEYRPPWVLSIAGANLITLLVLWIYWLWFRHCAGMAAQLFLATTIHCWLFWIGFPFLVPRT